MISFELAHLLSESQAERAQRYANESGCRVGTMIDGLVWYFDPVKRPRPPAPIVTVISETDTEAVLSVEWTSHPINTSFQQLDRITRG